MNYLKELWSVFESSLTNVWAIFASFVPVFLLAIVLFLVGIWIASIIGKAIAQVITATKVDKLFESAGMKEFLDKVGLKLNIGYFFGVIIKWFIIIVFLMASLQIINFTEVSQFIGQMIFLFLPKIIIIVIILMLAAIIADAVKKIVLASARVAKIKSSEALGAISKYAIWIIAIIIVLSQFDSIKSYISILLIGLVSFIVIAGGIAFGIGGKEAASRAIEKISKDMSSKM